MRTEDGPRAGAGGAGGGEPWFRRWFGPEYLALYPHRDREEAERGARLFLAETAVGAGDRLLDVGCGAGRHLAAFRARGVEAYGLDLSRPLLVEARAGTDRRAPLVQGDMRRLPYGGGRFDAATSFFTSFGYFSSRAEDRRVLGELRRVLREGGAYLLDFMNAEQVRRELEPREEGTVDGRTVVQTREIHDGHVVKRIEIEPECEGGAPEVYCERVRLYDPAELTAMLEECSLPVVDRFGDYGGGAHRDTSPRFIAVGRAR